MRTRSLPKIVLVCGGVFIALFFIQDYVRHPDDSSYLTFVRTLGSLFHRSGSSQWVPRAYAERHPEQHQVKLAVATVAAPTPDIRTSCTIGGAISDEQGHPVENARVTIRTANEAFSKIFTTGADGKWRAEAMPAGTYDILAAHDLFVTLIRPNYTLKESDRYTELDFRLPLGAKVQGLVTDEENNPLADVRVAARRRKAQQIAVGAQIYQDDSTYRTQVTDKPGTFTLAGVSVGPNVFEFSRPGYEAETRNIEITAQNVNEPIKTVLKKTGKLTGLVRDEDGYPVSTATVNLVRYKPFNGPEETIEKGKVTAVTDGEGKFTFAKLYTEGYYDLLIEEERFAPGIFPLVAVGSVGVPCTLERGGIIEGTVEYIDRPTTVASVLIAAESVVKGTTFTAVATSDGAGKFDFHHLPYGSYKLVADSTSIISEPKEGVTCQREKPTKDVKLEVYEASTVHGRVADAADDKAVPGAMITIKAAYGPAQSRSKTFQVRADAHGEFEFRQLPAGLHSALANAHGYRRVVTDRSEQKFTLTPGERKNDLSLILDHGGSVEGFVLTQNGRGLADCDIQLYAASQMDGHIDDKNLKGRTDVTGYFKIWGIEIGDRVQLYASARKKGFAKASSHLLNLTPAKPDSSTQIVLGPGGEISGKVTDRNNLPVPSAEVKFSSNVFPGDPSPSQIIAHTAADGTYTIETCPPGGANVQVSRSGYVKQARDVAIRDDLVTDRVDFQLENGNHIWGTVAGLDGHPVAGAKVVATGVNGAGGSDEDVTDKSGSFELSNLGEGEFQLEATFKLPTADGEQQYRFLKTPVAVGANGVSIDCDLGNIAAGRVEDEDGKGVSKFALTLRSLTDAATAQDFTFNLDRGLTDAHGYYRVLNIPRGMYNVTISADGFESYHAPDVAVGPHPSSDFPLVRLHPAGGVTGTVLSGSTNRPVNSAQVRLLDVTLSDADAAARAVAGTTDYSGQFRISSVPPGTYRVLVDHPSYLGTKLENINITRKKQTDLGNLFLEAGGAVRGMIVDDLGNPLPGITVKVASLSPPKETATDQAGNFLLQGVQAGRWSLVARGPVNSRVVYSFTTVDVQRDDTQEANFTLDTSADLDGMVAANDSPIRSASVFLHPFDENHVVLEDIHYDTDAQNQRFSLSQVPAGQYFLWATGYGAVGTFTAFKDLFLNRGHNDTTLQAPASHVHGALTDSTGQGIANLGIQLLPILQNLRLPSGLYNRLIQTTASGADGTFGLDFLQSGMYQLIHQTPQGTWYAEQPFLLSGAQSLQDYNIQVNP